MEVNHIFNYLKRFWLVRSDLSLNDLAKKICSDFPSINPKPKQILDIWNMDLHNIKCYNGVKDILQLLKGRYILSIISNTGPLTRPILKNLDLYDYFDFIFLSCELGILKPEIKIYKLSLETMDANSVHSYVVGDNPNTDLKPAKSLGMTTIFVDRYGQGKKYSFVDYKIKELYEIKDIMYL